MCVFKISQKYEFGMILFENIKDGSETSLGVGAQCIMINILISHRVNSHPIEKKSKNSKGTRVSCLYYQ